MPLPPGLAGFVAGRNQQGQEQSQNLGMLAQLAQLQGVMQKQQQQQALTGVLSSDLPMEQKQAALMKIPGGIGLLTQLAQQQEHAAKAAGAQRETAFYSPENQAKYTTPGRPEIALPEDIPGPVMPAQPGTMNTDAFRRDAALLSPRGMETYSQHQAQEAQARAAEQLRRDALAQNAVLSRERAAQAERQHGETIADRQQRAREAIQGRKDMIDAARAGRAAPAVTPVTIQDPNNPNATLVIDGRTKQVLGQGPKMTHAGVAEQKLSVKLPEARARIEGMTQNIDKLDTAIGELYDDPGLPRITGTLAGRTPNLTNTATGAQAQLNSIKSQIFVSALQAMREASKTGGAVGNVSDREGDKLEATLAALDQAQGTPAFKTQLNKARAQLRHSKALIKNAFEEQFANVQEPPSRRSTDGNDPLGIRR